MTLPTMVPSLGRDALLGWSRSIDDGPFSSLAVGERISFPNQEALVCLAAASAVTRRVRIIATVFVLPIHATAWIAKQVATLDVLSGGRFTMGVGVGGREEDYRVVGASARGRHARLDAQVAELRRIWAGEPAVADCAPIGPSPVQEGGPPIWIAAAAEAPLARAAHWASGFAGFSLGPDVAEVDRSFRGVEAAWRKAGRSASPYLATSFWYALGPRAADQLETYARGYLAVFGSRASSALAQRCRAAGAGPVRDALLRIRDAGADEVLLVPTSSEREELERTAELVSSL